jgi:hypothetical protein
MKFTNPVIQSVINQNPLETTYSVWMYKEYTFTFRFDDVYTHI